MKRFQTRSIMYLRWITFLTVIELLKSWSPSPMALTIHWWPFYPYTIPHTSSKYVTNNNAVKGFLYDILLQTLQTCHPDLENQKFEMTRYSTQQDFLQLVLNQTGHKTEFYMPLTIQDKADHIHKDGLQQRLPPDSTFLPVLECPGETDFVIIEFLWPKCALRNFGCIKSILELHMHTCSFPNCNYKLFQRLFRIVSETVHRLMNFSHLFPCQFSFIKKVRFTSTKRRTRLWAQILSQ